MVMVMVRVRVRVSRVMVKRRFSQNGIEQIGAVRAKYISSMQSKEHMSMQSSSP